MQTLNISNSSNVFAIKENTSTEYISWSKTEILNSIPKDATNEPDSTKGKTMIEWRWRIFKIPNKANETIEISKKHPDQQREYINKFGDWVKTDVDAFFDKFVTKQYYAYLTND